MPSFSAIKAFFEQASAQGARSTVLYPLQWLIGLTLTALVLANYFGAEPWVAVLLGWSLSISFILFGIAFVYFALTNPDALRSENYTLSKMAIEKSVIGDNLAGLINSTDSRTIVRELPAASLEEAQDE